MKVRVLYWLISFVIGSLPLYAQADLEDLLVNKLDYDKVIRKGEAMLTNASQAESLKVLPIIAEAYYKKGLLLLSSYRANLVLSSICDSCLASSGVRYQHIMFEQAMIMAANGRDSQAIELLIKFKKSDHNESDWSRLADVWLGGLYLLIGEKAKSDEVWNNLTSSDSKLFSERGFVLTMLNLNNKDAPNISTNIVQDPQQNRNMLLSGHMLSRLTRSSKVQALKALSLGKPVYSKTTGLIKEVYYDVFAPLAGAKCVLNIAMDLYASYFKLSTNSNSAQDVLQRFYYGKAAFLSEDYSLSLKLLENSAHPLASVYVGAAYSKLGNGQKASIIWDKCENSTYYQVQSQMAYIYATTAKRLDKARDILNRLMQNIPKSMLRNQSFFKDLGNVAMELGDNKRAAIIFNMGYNSQKDFQIGRDSNDPCYTLDYCIALQQTDRTNSTGVNHMLATMVYLYDVVKQLHDASTGTMICYDIKNTVIQKNQVKQK